MGAAMITACSIDGRLSPLLEELVSAASPLSMVLKTTRFGERFAGLTPASTLSPHAAARSAARIGTAPSGYLFFYNLRYALAQLQRQMDIHKPPPKATHTQLACTRYSSNLNSSGTAAPASTRGSSASASPLHSLLRIAHVEKFDLLKISIRP